MSTHTATHLHERTRTRARRSSRALIVLGLGPLTVIGGIVWAILQPWRITLAHPHGQSFWWLFVEPPLWAIVAGLVFALLVAPGVIADLEQVESRERRR